MTINYLLVYVLASQQVAANEAAARLQLQVDGTQGGDCFVTPLYAVSAPDDSTPVGYWCSPANRPPEVIAQINALIASSFPGASATRYTDPAFPASWLKANNLRTKL